MKKSNLKYPLVFYLLAFTYAQMAFSMERIADTSLTLLYKSSYSARSLYIPKKDLFDPKGEPLNIQELFKKNDICIYSSRAWKEEDWKETYSNFVQQTRHKPRNASTLDELPRLLSDAKAIIKSFLPPTKTTIPYSSSHFKKKSINPNLNRLFTYAQLQRIIEEKKLTHIRLPRKMLLIRDNNTKQYVSYKEAQYIIDTTLKVCVFHFREDEVNFKILFNSDRYTLELFAAKESSEGKGFSKDTMAELRLLCKEAPFDIGYENIFWDAKGDAVLIDTEHKGESSADCEKLSRYPIDPSL